MKGFLSELIVLKDLLQNQEKIGKKMFAGLCVHVSAVKALPAGALKGLKRTGLDKVRWNIKERLHQVQASLHLSTPRTGSTL